MEEGTREFLSTGLLQWIQHRSLAYWKATYVHQTTMKYVPTDDALDAALSTDATISLFCLYSRTNVDVEAVKIKNTVPPLPPPLFGILLKSDLYPVHSWDHLCGAIVKSGLTKEDKRLLDCLHIALVCNRPHTIYPIIVPEITLPVPDRDHFEHLHKLLVRGLPGIDPSLPCSHGSLIFENIRKVAVKIWANREERSHNHQQELKEPY